MRIIMIVCTRLNLRAVHKRRPLSGGRGFVQCEHFAYKEGEGSIFYDFVRTSFMDGPLPVLCTTAQLTKVGYMQTGQWSLD